MPTVTNSPTPPSSPADGDLWFNTLTGREYVWYIGPSASSWVQTQPSGTAVVTDTTPAPPVPQPPSPGPSDVTRTPVITIAQVPHTGPAEGDLWWSTLTGQMFVWNCDATSCQWTIANYGSGEQGPPGPPGVIQTVEAGTGLTGGGSAATVILNVDVTALGGPWLPLAGGTVTGDLGVGGNFQVEGVANVVGGLLYMGPPDASHALLRRLGTALESVLGDQSAYAPFHAGYFVSEYGLSYFGPADNTAPMLKRSATALAALLGDQSAYAPLLAATMAPSTDDNSVATTQWVTAKGYATIGQLGNYLPLTGGTVTGPLNVNSTFNALGGFVYFGAVDTSHPLLRRNGAMIDVVLADQSDYATINVKGVSATGDVSAQGAVAAATGYLYTGQGIVYFGPGDASHPMLRRSGAALEAVLGDQTAYTPFKAQTVAQTVNDETVATTAWVKTAVAGGGASISVGTAPPATPTAGALWWNTSAAVGGGTLYIWYVDGTSSQWVPAAAAVGSGAQPGDIKASASPNAQAGWLKCDGSAVTRAGYPGLFTAIGTLYGAGDGSSTFNLPDYRGRSLFGADEGAGRLGTGRPGGITTAATLGATGGEQNHITLNTETAVPGAAAGGVPGFATSTPYGPAAWSAAGGAGFYNASFEYGGLAHNNIPPAAVVYWYIKT